VNLRYALHQSLWKAADLLYPPVCSGCGKTNYRFCPGCLQSVSLIRSPFCAFCGKKTRPNQPVCSDCAGIPVHFTAAAAWAAYGGSLREAIHALKYKNDMGLGDFFARYMIEILLTRNWSFDLVIPVPLSPQRSRERTYNQSALLSRPVARYFHQDHSMVALRRIKDTGTQVKRNRMERDLSLTGAFSGNPATLKGRSVLLVDDIITTGATINHCSEALLRAGAVRVYAVALAKTFREKIVPEIN